MTTRRKFIKEIGFVTGGIFVTGNCFTSIQGFNSLTSDFQVIKIEGIVRESNRGIPNVIVSDGLSVTKTKSDGTFQLLSNAQQKFIFLSVPANYSIPVNPMSTAKFYQPIITNSKSEMFASFELKKTETEDKYSYIVLSDIHAHNLEIFHTESVPDVLEQLKQSKYTPLFGVACGDMMSDHLEYFPNYEKGVRNIGIPFFQVVGNHDLNLSSKTYEQSTDTFCKHFGPCYYSFTKGGVHYVVLNDVFWVGGEYIGYIDEKQLNWLKDDLSYLEKGSSVVIFAHIPIYCKRHIRANEKKPSNIFNVTNRSLLYDILKPYNSIIISGHTHENEFLIDGGCELHISGAVCGAWWTDSICYDGTPKGYLVYDVDGDEISWQYKSIGKNINHQMRVYEAKDTNGIEQIVANVWGANDKLKVYWYENGIRKGEMQKHVGLDPLSIELYSGNGMPAGRTWIEPSPTDHLFHAHPLISCDEIVIEVIDIWGRIYKDKLIRKN